MKLDLSNSHESNIQLIVTKKDFGSQKINSKEITRPTLRSIISFTAMNEYKFKRNKRLSMNNSYLIYSSLTTEYLSEIHEKFQILNSIYKIEKKNLFESYYNVIKKPVTNLIFCKKSSSKTISGPGKKNSSVYSE
ncbi:hypothetical protein CWI36_0151p0010 [Hamiltosporidium magnivora]|uniref:Uncharacterized protein n=1 Tax=Hamiltosporidium magnivora TaxID=148818 RepID=A0A4Q9LJX7_9MICR|nr:hypothetical protein CWI36_0151p0010 [Hamiltosporidium magnivora]